MTKQVLIVDDILEVRRDLRTLLSLSGDIEVVGEAANGQEAICQVEALHPDVVLLDLDMPVLDGYQAASQIKARFPSCQIIALTVHDYDRARKRALEAGTDHFFVKGTHLEKLIHTILEGTD